MVGVVVDGTRFHDDGAVGEFLGLVGAGIDNGSACLAKVQSAAVGVEGFAAFGR